MIQIPTTCPVCGSSLVLTENHTKLYCPNMGCSSRIQGRLQKWTAVLKIKEFGTATIEKLSERFTKVSDIYTEAPYEYLSTLDGYGERSLATLKAEIESHKDMSLAAFLAGFNIGGFAERKIQAILDKVGAETLNTVLALSEDQLLKAGVSKKSAKAFHDGILALKDDMIETAAHVRIGGGQKMDTSTSQKSSVLNGQSFCFTGKAFLPRKELQQAVRDNGGVVFDTVKHGLDVLVMADPSSTSTKARAARKMGIQLMSEDDFVKLVGLAF